MADEDGPAQSLGAVKALERAEKAAKALLSAGFGEAGAPSEAQVTEVLLRIDHKNWPVQTRPNVTPDAKPVTGFSMGLVYGLGGKGMKVSKTSEVTPNLTKLLTAYITSSIPDKDFKYSSLQVNYCYAAKKHTDGNNLGPSYIQAIGEHTGGGLWTADQGVVDPNRKWASFNGCKEHCTQPFKGTRISLIAFTHNSYEELSEELCERLRGLGFMAVGSERIRDQGDVDEESFDAFWDRRRADAAKADTGLPAELALPAGQAAGQGGWVAVDCAGWACGRGSSWVAYEDSKGNAKTIGMPLCADHPCTGSLFLLNCCAPWPCRSTRPATARVRPEHVRVLPFPSLPRRPHCHFAAQ